MQSSKNRSSNIYILWEIFSKLRGSCRDVNGFFSQKEDVIVSVLNCKPEHLCIRDKCNLLYCEGSQCCVEPWYPSPAHSGHTAFRSCIFLALVRVNHGVFEVQVIEIQAPSTKLLSSSPVTMFILQAVNELSSTAILYADFRVSVKKTKNALLRGKRSLCFGSLGCFKQSNGCKCAGK